MRMRVMSKTYCLKRLGKLVFTGREPHPHLTNDDNRSTNGEYEEARDSVLRALGGENKSTS